MHRKDLCLLLPLFMYGFLLQIFCWFILKKSMTNPTFYSPCFYFFICRA
jgi:hypothetical protein